MSQTSGPFVWQLTDAQRNEWLLQFQKLDTDKTLFLSGKSVKPFFDSSGLSAEDLKIIWELSDMDKDGRLSEREFLIAQFLVFACKSGQLLPARLPQSLIDSLSDAGPSRAGQTVQSQAGTVSGGGSDMTKVSSTTAVSTATPKKQSLEDDDEMPMPSKRPPATGRPKGSKVTLPQETVTITPEPDAVPSSIQKNDSTVNPTEFQSPSPSPNSISTTTTSPAPTTMNSVAVNDNTKSSNEVAVASNNANANTSATPPNNVASNSAAVSPNEMQWIIPEPQRKFYKEVFKGWAPTGFLTGQQAVALFTQSGLSYDILGHIWQLSDLDGDNQLSEQEFLIAMHLISLCREGKSLPESVPTVLVASASKKPKNTTDKSKQTSQSPSSSPSPPTTNAQSLSTSSVARVPIPAEYNAAQDIANLQKDFIDLLNAQKYVVVLEAEISLLMTELERQNGTVASLTDKLNYRRSEVVVLQQRKQQLQTILTSFSAQLKEEEAELVELTKDLGTMWQTVEQQHQQLLNPSFSLSEIRNKRRTLMQNFNAQRKQYKEGEEEYTRLVKEVEGLISQMVGTKEQQLEIEAQFKLLTQSKQKPFIEIANTSGVSDEKIAQLDKDIDQVYRLMFGAKSTQQQFTERVLSAPETNPLAKTFTVNKPIDDWVPRRTRPAHVPLPPPLPDPPSKAVPKKVEPSTITKDPAFNPFGLTSKDAKKQSAAQARLERHLKTQEDVKRKELKKQRKEEEKARKKALKEQKKLEKERKKQEKNKK
jgi:hypothetical protein